MADLRFYSAGCPLLTIGEAESIHWLGNEIVASLWEELENLSYQDWLDFCVTTYGDTPSPAYKDGYDR